jgi:CheY-like chemotaxis protein
MRSSRAETDESRENWTMETRKAKHILIVEDAPDLQILLSRLFKGESYEVSQAYNGQQAIDLLNSMSELPNLILLDLMMPVMDGVEFRQRQRKDPRFSSIPVVVMTADSNSQVKIAQLGVTDFVRKPIDDLNRLLDLVERV